MRTTPLSSSLVSLGGSSALKKGMGPLSQERVPSMGLQSEDSGKASAAGLGGQGWVVAKPGLEVPPTLAGRCSPDHCQGSDPAPKC